MIHQTVENISEQYLRVKMSEIKREARSALSGMPCRYCNESGSLCKSHSVPKSFLTHITGEGHVRIFNSLTEIMGIDTEEGIKNAGTFRLICSKCDGTIFHTYESEDNYDRNLPSQTILAEIAMKNYLQLIYKRLIEQDVQKRMRKVGLIYYLEEKASFDVCSHDLKTYISFFEKAKSRAKDETSTAYEVIFYKMLDYIVPLAAQTSIALRFDFMRNQICDVYSSDPKYEIWEVHLCIFPFKNSSIVLLFIDKEGISQYQSFINQFNTYSELERLAIINYILFLYSENIFISKTLPDEIIQSPALKKVAGTGIYDIIDRSPFNFLKTDSDIRRDDMIKYDLQKFNSIPNLLDEKYKIT